MHPTGRPSDLLRSILFEKNSAFFPGAALFPILGGTELSGKVAVGGAAADLT